MIIGTIDKDKKVQAYNIDTLLKKDKAHPYETFRESVEDTMIRTKIVKCMNQGFIQQTAPRVEFNDLSLLDRYQVDKLSFNAYQPNNGEPLSRDVREAWRSNAMKPVIRNQVMSIAAHTLARNLYPNVTARDKQNVGQKASATVMEGLLEYAADDANYEQTALKAITTALFSPACFVYKEYADVYRMVIDRDGNPQKIKDTSYSGFRDEIVTVDELFVENFYEHDIQKQAWLIWRKTPTYESAKAKYSKYPAFKYVHKGMQTVFNDANQLYYNVYDPQLRGELVEEILYWNRAEDSLCIMVNGVVLSCTPNPRIDKKYPFTKFGYQLIDEGRFFYYKSLAFSLQQDARVINTLYPLFVDSAILETNPPLVNSGGEIVTSDVVVPGTVTNFTSEGAKLNSLLPPKNTANILNAMAMVEESVNATAVPPVEQGSENTATEALLQRQQAVTVLDLFVKMVRKFVVEYGDLTISDIIQYCTVANAVSVGGELTYQSFVLHDKQSKSKPKKFKFEANMPAELTEKEAFYESAKTALGEPDVELFRINPRLFRDFDFNAVVFADTLAPQSTELERAYIKELYTLLAGNPIANQEELVRLILESSPATKKNVDKYIAEQPTVMGAPNPAPTENPDAMAQPPINQNAGLQASPAQV